MGTSVFRSAGGALGEAIEGIVNFLYKTGEYGVEQVSAVPEFVSTIRKNQSAMAVVKDTGRILADVAMCLAVKAAHDQIQSAVEDNYSDSSMISCSILWAAYLLNLAATAWQFRQKVKVTVRTAVLLTQHSRVFKDASDPVRYKLSDEVCQDCNTSRYIKGDVRDFMIYLGQQWVIDKVVRQIPYGGNISATLLTYLLRGQLVVSYRLANEGICERHRAVYFREYMELCLSLGLSVDLTAELLACAIEYTTGLPREQCRETFKHLMSVYFVGLSHHMKFPSPKRQTKRLHDPLTFSRAVGTEVMEVVIPGVKQALPRWFRKRTPTIDLFKLLDRSVTFYTDPKTQRVLILFLPKMVLGLQPFVQDPVVSHYWRPIRLNMLEVLDIIDKIVATYGTSNTKTGAFIQWVDTMSGGKAVKVGVSWYFGIPEALVGELVTFFRSPEYRDWSRRVRRRLVRMRAETDQEVRYGNYQDLLDLSAPANQDRLLALTAPRDIQPMLAIASSDADQKHLSTHTDTIDLHDEVPMNDPDEMPILLKQMLMGTIDGLATYQSRVHSQRNWLTGPGKEGKKRLAVFNTLLNKCPNEAYKYVICLALLKNKNTGATLWHDVFEKVLHQSGKMDITCIRSFEKEIYVLFDCENDLVQQGNFQRAFNEIIELANSSPKSSEIDARCTAMLSDLEDKIPQVNKKHPISSIFNA